MLVAMGLLSAPTTDAIGMGIGTSVGYLVLLGFGTGYVPSLFLALPFSSQNLDV